MGKKRLFLQPMNVKGFKNIKYKKRLSSLKLGVSSVLCGFRADLWPFNGIFLELICSLRKSKNSQATETIIAFSHKQILILNATQQCPWSQFELRQPVAQGTAKWYSKINKKPRYQRDLSATFFLCHVTGKLNRLSSAYYD